MIDPWTIALILYFLGALGVFMLGMSMEMRPAVALVVAILWPAVVLFMLVSLVP